MNFKFYLDILEDSNFIQKAWSKTNVEREKKSRMWLLNTKENKIIEGVMVLKLVLAGHSGGSELFCHEKSYGEQWHET